MSWITSAKCFNGLVCIGDVQATITYPNGKIEYINCIKKIYNIYDNLVVGFAGDIKVALLMIEKLEELLAEWLDKDTLFDLDGQVYELKENLKFLYNEFCGNLKPKVELIFCWYAQDEGEYEWNLYNWKFVSPNFSNSGDGKIQSPIQIGSGNNNINYQNSLEFLTGEDIKRRGKFKNLFNTNPEMIIWTVTKYKNFLINQAQQENFNGVSKSFYSYEAIINYDKLYSPEENHIIKTISKNFGLEFQPKIFEGDLIHSTELSTDKFKKMLKKDPIYAIKSLEKIEQMIKKVNLVAFYEKPNFKEEFHLSKNEEIDKICTSWDEFNSFMKKKYNLVIGTSAFATA